MISIIQEKGRKSIYIAPFIPSIVSKCSDINHTVLPANYTTPAFFCKRSPDSATPNWGSRHPIAAYYSFIDPKGMKGWVGLVGRRFTHISGQPSAKGRAQDRESLPAKDRRSAAVPRNQRWHCWLVDWKDICTVTIVFHLFQNVLFLEKRSKEENQYVFELETVVNTEVVLWWCWWAVALTQSSSLCFQQGVCNMSV